jgi:hypothetical protein
MDNYDDRHKLIMHVMQDGFSNAAVAFGKITGCAIGHTPVVRTLASDLSVIAPGDASLLVTQLIGDFPGTSYLVIPAIAEEMISRKVCFQRPQLGTGFREAFLLELTNIVSAAVVTELSNFLQAELYGDVPQLKRMEAINIPQYLSMDSEACIPSGITMATTFQLDSDNEIQFPFLWKISSKIFEFIPAFAR